MAGLKQLKHSPADVLRYCVDSENVSAVDKFKALVKTDKASIPEFHAGLFTLVPDADGNDSIMLTEHEKKEYVVSAYKAKKTDLAGTVTTEEGEELRLLVSKDLVVFIKNSDFWVVKETKEKGVGSDKGKESYKKLMGESFGATIDQLYASLDVLNAELTKRKTGHRFNVYVRYPKAAEAE